MTFGRYLRKRREKLGLTLRAFCLEAEVDPGNISKYERGTWAAPHCGEGLEKMAKALKLNAKAKQRFMDMALISSGRIPPDIMEHGDVVSRMPLVFHALRDQSSRERLIKLAEKMAVL